MEAIRTEEAEVVAVLDDSVTLWDYIQSQASDLSLDLYDLDNSGSGRLRVFIDKHVSANSEDDKVAKRGSHVTSDDCSKLIRKLVHGLAVHGSKLGVGSEPEIEVSSPGIERVLRLPKHFQGAVGEKVKVITKSGFVNGILVGFDGGSITLKTGDKDVSLLLDDIKKAQVEY